MGVLKCTINGAKIPGSLSNNTITITENMPGLTAEFWAGVTDTVNGLDIRFYDSDNSTELDREIVKFSASGILQAHVIIPNLILLTNKIIYMHWAEGTAPNSTITWTSSNATGIGHLQDNVDDSAGIGNFTRINGAYIDAYLNRGFEGGINDVITLSRAPWTHDFTACGIITVNSINGSPYQSNVIFQNANRANSAAASFYLSNYGAGNQGFAINIVNAGAVTEANVNVNPSTYIGNTYHWVLMVDSNPNMYLYINGVLTLTLNSIPNLNAFLYTAFGKGESNISFPHYSDCDHDEIMIYDVYKGGDWAVTQYENLMNQSTFATFSVITPPTPPGDSWDGLGNLDTKLIQFPNWISEPQDNFELNQELLQFLGTATDITVAADRIENSLEYQILFDTRQKQYEFLEFFAARYGRLQRFWLPELKNYFKLYNNVNSGDSYIDVYHSNYNKIFAGYERLFIYTSDFKYISRKITSVVDNGSYETINLETPIDRDLETTDIIYFSRLFLARFDLDEVEVRYITDIVSRVDLRFLELVKEYELVEDSAS